ncbi:4-galactosyl-N-acetylglucosaminide 3-alpha-L-fucosyltransferase FUT6-like [Convolutriloba macropyga]|uniref:4-galactosyl-N-acetylglucosaminide 3-alpha-L-fucosyltransferase FUT6-like n=1 Tax=Convolutriloba macropyga TaxID=536237 RepID=UPI003F526DCA
MFSKNRYKIAQSLIESLSSKIHIWGRALRLGCFKPDSQKIVNHGEIGGLGTSYYDVAQTHIKDCKFYLAFENTNCSDYVTEKFMNAIEAGAIPIVVSWWDTYEKLLPGSFIHVNKFANTSQLAEYLESLLKDEKKMNKYHEWRKIYRYERTGVKAACELCRKLENLKIAQLNGKKFNHSVIKNMAEEFKRLQSCAS